MKQTSRIIFLAITYFVPFYFVSAQNLTHEIEINAGLPLYQEKYFSEKLFSFDNNQLCHDGVRKSGYFSKGGVFYSADYHIGLEINKVKFKIGASFSVLQRQEKAIADSALKYADCDDPSILEKSRQYIFSLPIGISYNFEKLEFGAAYYLPIYTLSRHVSTQISGNERELKANYMFYKKDAFDEPYYYVKLYAFYSVSPLSNIGVSYAFNNVREINHLNLSLKISLKNG